MATFKFFWKAHRWTGIVVAAVVGDRFHAAPEEAGGLDTNEHGADAYADFRITYR